MLIGLHLLMLKLRHFGWRLLMLKYFDLQILKLKLIHLQIQMLKLRHFGSHLLMLKHFDLQIQTLMRFG